MTLNNTSKSLDGKSRALPNCMDSTGLRLVTGISTVGTLDEALDEGKTRNCHTVLPHLRRS